jgi:hypothetical protein
MCNLHTLPISLVFEFKASNLNPHITRSQDPLKIFLIIITQKNSPKYPYGCRETDRKQEEEKKNYNYNNI